MPLTKYTASTAIIAALADLPNATSGLTAAQLKAKFDENPTALKTYINDVLTVELDTILSTDDADLAAHKISGDHDARYYTETELNSGQLDTRYFTETEIQSTTDGASGADKIGATLVSSGSGTQVQSILEWLYSQITNVTLGQIVDGSLTNAKLATDIKVGSLAALTTTDKSSVVAAVNEHVAETVASGAHGLDGTIAKFKSGSSSFTDNDTAQTFTDTFCTANSLVTIAITSGTAPQGVWTVTSAAGTFTVSSTVAESADITFDYYITKVVG